MDEVREFCLKGRRGDKLAIFGSAWVCASRVSFRLGMRRLFLPKKEK
jgi:hypothetical protein